MNPEDTGYIAGITFSPDGKMLAAGIDHSINLWDVETRKAIGQRFKTNFGSITSVTFSPDGKMLATGGGDRNIILWNVGTGESLSQSLSIHTDTITSIAFSPDGRTLASGSGDNTIVLWDVETGQPIDQPLRGHTKGVSSIAFSPDGKLLASGSYDGVMILWDVSPLSWVEQTCLRAGRNLTRTEWKQYLGNEPHQAVCPILPIEAEPSATPVKIINSYYTLILWWPIIPYIVYGLIAYRAITSNFNSFSPSPYIARHTWKHFVIAVAEGDY